MIKILIMPFYYTLKFIETCPMPKTAIAWKIFVVVGAGKT